MSTIVSKLTNHTFPQAASKASSSLVDYDALLADDPSTVKYIARPLHKQRVTATDGCSCGSTGG